MASKELEFYPTPTYAIDELLKREEFSFCIWEPACGTGNISKAIKATGTHVAYSSDIVEYDFSEQDEVIDFLQCVKDASIADDIITNPPFKLALEFAKKGLELSNRKLALFLRLAFLESQSRKDFFLNSPLKTVYVFSKRLTLYPDGIKTAGSGIIPFAWFVWDKEYNGKPQIDWI